MFQNGGGWFGDFGAPSGPFIESYRCNSMSFHDKEDKENGDKIILPSSAFEKLARMTITYPMQFQLTNDTPVDLTDDASAPTAILRTHVGVLEFTAQEGRCFVPYWIMHNLGVEEGGIISVKNVTLPLAQFIKFQPMTVDFLDISNPKAVLESTLRNFSCVTLGDKICLPYNGRKYYLNVKEVKPQEACSIVEADVKVDFEAPMGYKEPERIPKAPATPPTPANDQGNTTGTNTDKQADPNAALAELAKARAARLKQLEAKKSTYQPFSGTGRRVDGKTKNNTAGGAEADTKTTTTPGTTTGATGAVRKSKWKSKTKGSSFLGEGRSLS
uniref:Uncharacterized protein n=1 Tax=Mucochytrium quahogii TaxID=96639 RepID=A0A7S2RPA4_9STRA|mmetsp:Transcript_6634/g.10444  ORF Transcript_6634/g.10444 Transcript_6634/m.10444 type:complete len:329 (+) Transcript_6634:77-1063(+)